MQYHKAQHAKKRKQRESETIRTVPTTGKSEKQSNEKLQKEMRGAGEKGSKSSKKNGEKAIVKNEKEGEVEEKTKKDQKDEKLIVASETKSEENLKKAMEVEVRVKEEQKNETKNESKESKESKEPIEKDQPKIVAFFHSSTHPSSHENNTQPSEPISSIQEAGDTSSIPEIEKNMEVDASVETSEKPQTEEEGETCNICGYGYSEPDDQLVFCEHCNLAVHQSCYGIATLPEGDWMCSVCLHGKSPNNTYCYICNKSGGAMRCTEDGIFVHLICVFYTPELSLNFSGPEVLVEGIGRISRERAQLVCSICGLKGGGCVQCSSRQCSIAYHPYCAQQVGYLLTSDEKGGQFMYLSYCKSHTQRKNDRKTKLNGNKATPRKRRRAANRKRRVKEQEPTCSIPKEILDK